MNQKLGLIGGCGSSGTTLLAHLLDGLADVCCSPESYIFHHKFLFEAQDFKKELYRALAQLSPGVFCELDGWKFPLLPPIFVSGRAFLDMTTIYQEYDLFHTAENMVGVASWFHRRMADRHGFPVGYLWIDQTPKNILASTEFLRAFPGAKFVHLLRDGKDVVASLAKRYAFEFPGKTRSAYLHMAALRWCFDVFHGLQARSLPGYLEITYEDLTADPLKGINLVLQHFDRAPVSKVDLAAKKSYAAEHFPQLFLGGNKPSWGADPTKEVSTKSVGKWRKELSQDEVTWLRDVSFSVRGFSQKLHFCEVLEKAGYRMPEA